MLRISLDVAVILRVLAGGADELSGRAVLPCIVPRSLSVGHEPDAPGFVTVIEGIHFEAALAIGEGDGLELAETVFAGGLGRGHCPLEGSIQRDFPAGIATPTRQTHSQH